MIFVGRSIWRYVGRYGMTIAVAVLLQALYLKHPDPLTGTLAPTNQSPWELSKALFWPYLCGILLFGENDDGARRNAQYLMLLILPLLCVTVFSVFSGANHWMVWCIVLAAGMTMELLMVSKRIWGGELLWVTLAILLGIAYLLFTVLPPMGGIFLDPRDVTTFAPIPF